MDPKIVFLGTGGDSYVVGKQLRSASGIVLRLDGYQFIIDPGPGLLCKAREYGISLRETTGVFVTHAHLNHSHDLNALISAMTYNGFDRQGVVVAPSSVIRGDEETGLIQPLATFFANCVERVISINPGQRVGIEHVEVQALHAHHDDTKAVGYRFEKHSFVLTYSGDTSYSSRIAEQYKKSDILVLNVVHSEKKSDALLCIDDARRVMDKARPKLCILTHFGSKMLDADPLYQARELQKKTGVQVIAAVDGLEINPATYAAEADQKTLTSYR